MGLVFLGFRELGVYLPSVGTDPSCTTCGANAVLLEADPRRLSLGSRLPGTRARTPAPVLSTTLF